MNLANFISKILRLTKKAKFKFDKLYFFKIDLNDFSFDLRKNDIKIKIAENIQDLKEIISERGATYINRYEKWFKRNYICYYAIIDNKGIGLLWLNNTNIVELLFGYKEKVKDRNTEAWVIDGYVLKEYRGYGAYKLIWHRVLYEAKENGIKYIYAAIYNSNINSFKIHFKLGMNNNVYKILYFFRIIWIKIYLFKYFPRFQNIKELRKDIRFD